MTAVLFQKICIIIPVHNEQENIQPLTERLLTVINGLSNYSFEIVFVDDGSRDKTIAEIEKAIAQNFPVGYIQLSRNFGHQNALEAGIASVDADAIITMDGDLQHPPEEIPRMIESYEAGADVVQMQRVNAGENFKGILSVAFYTFFKWISDFPLVPNAADFRLISRRVAQQVINMPGKGKLLRALIPSIGFTQVHLKYKQPERKFGKPSYSFFDSYELAIQTIFKVSRFPAHFTFTLGGLLLIAGIILSLLNGFDVLPDNKYSFITALFLLLGASIFLVASVICWYLYFILEQARQDPSFVIKKIISPVHKATAL